MPESGGFLVGYLRGAAQGTSKFRRIDAVHSGDAPPVTSDAVTGTGWTVGTLSSDPVNASGLQYFNSAIEGGVERAASSFQYVEYKFPEFLMPSLAYADALSPSLGNAFVYGPLPSETLIVTGGPADSHLGAGYLRHLNMKLSAVTSASGQDGRIELGVVAASGLEGTIYTASGRIHGSVGYHNFVDLPATPTDVSTYSQYGFVTPPTPASEGAVHIYPAGAYLCIYGVFIIPPRNANSSLQPQPATNTKADVLFVEGPDTYLPIGYVHPRPLYQTWTTPPRADARVTAFSIVSQTAMAASLAASSDLSAEVMLVQPSARFATQASAEALMQPNLRVPKKLRTEASSAASLLAALDTPRLLAAALAAVPQLTAPLVTAIPIRAALAAQSDAAAAVSTSVRLRALLACTPQLTPPLTTAIPLASVFAAQATCHSTAVFKSTLRTHLAGESEASAAMDTAVRLRAVLSGWASSAGRLPTENSSRISTTGAHRQVAVATYSYRITTTQELGNGRPQ